MAARVSQRNIRYTHYLQRNRQGYRAQAHWRLRYEIACATKHPLNFQENTMPRALLILILLPFSVVTTLALWHHGFWGIVEPHFKSWGAGQVFFDLVIALTLFIVWMVNDARATGRNPWPWLVATLITGSFGPLVYLLTRKTPAPRG
jgi:hypothetical protein